MPEFIPDENTKNKFEADLAQMKGADGKPELSINDIHGIEKNLSADEWRIIHDNQMKPALQAAQDTVDKEFGHPLLSKVAVNHDVGVAPKEAPPSAIMIPHHEQHLSAPPSQTHPDVISHKPADVQHTKDGLHETGNLTEGEKYMLVEINHEKNLNGDNGLRKYLSQLNNEEYKDLASAFSKVESGRVSDPSWVSLKGDFHLLHSPGSGPENDATTFTWKGQDDVPIIESLPNQELRSVMQSETGQNVMKYSEVSVSRIPESKDSTVTAHAIQDQLVHFRNLYHEELTPALNEVFMRSLVGNLEDKRVEYDENKKTITINGEPITQLLRS